MNPVKIVGLSTASYPGSLTSLDWLAALLQCQVLLLDD